MNFLDKVVDTVSDTVSSTTGALSDHFWGGGGGISTDPVMSALQDIAGWSDNFGSYQPTTIEAPPAASSPKVDSGKWLSPRRGVNLGVPIQYGTRRVAGIVIFQSVSDDNNFLYRVYALAEGQQNTWDMYIDNGKGEMVAFADSKYYRSPAYGYDGAVTVGATYQEGSEFLSVEGVVDYMQHIFRNNISVGGSNGLNTGNLGNTWQNSHVSLGPQWSDQHNCKGVACEGIAFVYDYAKFFEPQTYTLPDGTRQTIAEHKLRTVMELEPFFDGVPKVEFELKGKTIKDHEDATKDRDDPAWVLYDYLTNDVYGCGLDADLIDSTSFVTASDICDDKNSAKDSTGADITPKTYSCNIVLDSKDTLITNIKKILATCNGRLNWINGKYYLQIDDIFSGTAVFAFQEKHIIGGLKLMGASKSERSNQYTAKFVNPEKMWKEDEVSWPDKNDESSDYDSFLSEDGGVPLRKNIRLSGVTNRHQARFMAKQAVLRSRNAIKVTFIATSEAMNVIVGDIITITHTTPSWSAKEFRVRSITLHVNGTCKINAVEHLDSIYAWDYVQPPTATNDTNLPDPKSVNPPSSIRITETTYSSIASGGAKIRITADWTSSTDTFVEKYEVQFKKSSEDNTKWKDGGTTVASSVVLNDFEKGDFDFRVRAVNALGARSNFTTEINVAVLGTTAIPEDVTGFTVQNHGDNATVTWDEPDDATDIDHIAIGVLQEGSTEWDDAVVLANVGTGNTSTIVPVIKGNYVAKWVNSGGFESVDYMESGAVTVYGSELVATYAEQEAWAGTLDGLYETVDDGDDVLKFLGTVNWDDFTMEMDYWGQVDEQGGRSETAHYTGVARDLGAVLPARVYSNKIFTSAVSDGSNFLDNWGSIDARDSWDETTSLDSLITQIRTTQDDPADAGATWTAYKPFIVADVVARGLQMKVTFDQFSENEQFTLRELELLVDMVVRFESDRAKTATSITYDDPFYAIPDLVVTPVNMATGDYMTISSETKTGFGINFYNSSAVAQTRTYNYHARGF